MKNGCLVVFGVAMFLWMLAAWNLPDNTAEKMTTNATLPPEVCAKVEGMVQRAFPYDDFNNSSPGILYMPTRAWTGSSGAEREIIGKALAFQKACAFGGDPGITTVEIRSINDNQVLAKGMYWEIKSE